MAYTPEKALNWLRCRYGGFVAGLDFMKDEAAMASLKAELTSAKNPQYDYWDIMVRFLDKAGYPPKSTGFAGAICVDFADYMEYSKE